MRVLHLISSGGMYGAEAVILNLSQQLNRAGSDASFLGVFEHAGLPVPMLHEVAVRSGVPSTLLPCRGQMDRSMFRALRKHVELTGADVIHAHGYKADIYAFLALRGSHRPALVSTCHTWYDNDLAVRVYGAADRWVLRSFDQVVAVSAEVHSRLLGAGVAPAKVHLIRNGISLTPFQNAPQTRAARIATTSSLRVGLVGRLAPEKGVDIFLGAVARIANRFPDAHFVVAGDGPDRELLEAQIASLGLQGRAELLGPQTDMPAIYASLDVLVSASRQEGLPMALLEGMASGLPLIATRAGAVPEIVVEGETGLLVNVNDPVALADAIERVLTDREQCERFGSAGRQRVLDQFSAQRMASEYLKVYRAALEARGTASAGAQGGRG